MLDPADPAGPDSVSAGSFFTNRGGATGEDIAQLARFVQQRVQSGFGVVLQPESVLVDLEL